MSQDVWSGHLTAVIASQVRMYRAKKGMSVQQLSDAVGRLGVKIQRPVLANLENGRRPTISVAELFALAAALEVPPLLLAFPLGLTESMEVLPGKQVTPFEALGWAESGLLAGVSDSAYEEATLIRRYRDHARLTWEWEQARREALRCHEESASAVDTKEQAVLLKEAEAWDRDLIRIVKQLRDVRQSIVRFGRTPAALPTGLRYLDDEERSDG